MRSMCLVCPEARGRTQALRVPVWSAAGAAQAAHAPAPPQHARRSQRAAQRGAAAPFRARALSSHSVAVTRNPVQVAPAAAPHPPTAAERLEQCCIQDG